MNTAYIYEYWGRTEFGRRMIESDKVSESDLLFLMPNNVKKMHGLPMTRVAAKRKSNYKRLRKRMILSSVLFQIIEEIIEEPYRPEACDGEFFCQFVDFKNLNFGGKNKFVPCEEEN